MMFHEAACSNFNIPPSPGNIQWNKADSKVSPCKYKESRLSIYQKNNNHTAAVHGHKTFDNDIFDDMELVNSTDSDRNWKGLLLALLVITIVCSLVGLSAWVLQPLEDEISYQHKYDFDAMFDPTWKPFTVKGEWIKDVYIYQDRYKNVMKYEDGNLSVLITNSTYFSFGTHQYSVSNDLKFALLSFEAKKLYRHSFRAKYFIYNINLKQHTSLSDEIVDYAEWGNSDNDIVFVQNGDIYYKKSTTAKPQRISFNGADSNGNIKNGIADWVYEEEVFSSSKANWLSDDNSYLAYASFDDTLVPEISIYSYQSGFYPEEKKIHYPKAGFPNPIVSVFVHNIDKNITVKINSTNKYSAILWTFTWLNNHQFIIKWSNRYQNESETSICTLRSKYDQISHECTIVQQEEVAGWIQYLESPPVAGRSGSYFQIEESYHGGMGSFYHINEIQFIQTKHQKSRFLTSGNFEITEILTYNHMTNELYYISNEKSVGGRHVYAVDIDTYMRRCITCEINCSYFTASMSKSSTYIMTQCLGPGVPVAAVLNLNTKEATILEGNKEIFAKLNDTYLPQILYDNVEITIEQEKHMLSAKLILPSNYQLKKLSLLVSMYAAPGSQKVNSRFSLDWNSFLATNHETAILLFDGRGSGYKGTKILKSINRKLGSYEIDDQISAIQQILHKHQYLDPTKVAVFGWSYGGYAAAMAATNKHAIDSNLIKCAISVAPVTNWRYYDSIYTERYMGPPSYNMNGYNEADLTSRAELFNDFDYLLIHGLSDDNVHYQNSAVLEKALVDAQIHHKLQVYTDENHSLGGTKTQRHLYRMMTDFLTRCFQR